MLAVVHTPAPERLRGVFPLLYAVDGTDMRNLHMHHRFFAQLGNCKMSMDVMDLGSEAVAAPAKRAAPAFVHLRVHSEYSIVDGLVRIDDIVGAAAKDKQPALAITDLDNLFGMVKFYKAARGTGIKPVIGVDA